MSKGEGLNRKYHELRGWKLIEVTHSPDPCGRRDTSTVWADKDGDYDFVTGGILPALHLDANLMIAELDRVFETWEFKSVVRGSPFGSDATNVRLKAWLTEGRNPGSKLPSYIEQSIPDGPHAFCEAGLLALIASKEQK